MTAKADISTSEIEKQIESSRVAAEEIKKKQTELQAMLIESKKADFAKKYGIDCDVVVEGYKVVVHRCGIQGGRGYSFYVPLPDSLKPYNPQEPTCRYPKVHWVLDPQHYTKCKPTPMIFEAFSILGISISMEDKPHDEIWGN